MRLELRIAAVSWFYVFLACQDGKLFFFDDFFFFFYVDLIIKDDEWVIFDYWD